jgi:erythromycin esterase-like protein
LGRDTEEILALVEWMCGFNLDPANHTSGRSVEFAGIGMQMPALAAAAVRDFVAANLPSLLPKAETACKAVKVTIGPRDSGYADAILPANI